MDGRFTAPGKIILFGEHAVVYGKPAIAIPVSGMRATAWSEISEDGLTINALDIGEKLLRPLEGNLKAEYEKLYNLPKAGECSDVLNHSTTTTTTSRITK